MRRPVRVLHASRSVHTAPDHVSSPSSYAFFLHLLLLLLLAPFILPFLSWIQDSSFVHNDHSSSFPFGFPLSSPLPLLFPLSPFFRIILSLLGSVIAVLSLFYIYIYIERVTHINIWPEMKNSYASFALPFALSSCLLFMNTGSRSKLPEQGTIRSERERKVTCATVRIFGKTWPRGVLDPAIFYRLIFNSLFVLSLSLFRLSFWNSFHNRAAPVFILKFREKSLAPLF